MDAQDVPGAVVVLVSDGDHDPPDGSDYPVPPSATAPGWKELRAKAALLRDVTAYALPLAGSTSVRTLSVVFPGAQTLTPKSSAQIQKELRSVTLPRRRAIATEALAADARPRIAATWVGDGLVDGKAGQAPRPCACIPRQRTYR